MVAPRLGNLPPPALRMEAIGLDLAVARQDGAHQRDDAGVRMIERQRIVDAIFARAQARQAAERGVPGAGRDLVAMRQDAALRPARRAGGIQDAGRRLGDGAGCRAPRRDAFSREPRTAPTTITGGAVRALRQGLRDRGLSRAEGQDEVGLAVIDEIGDLRGAVVRIDRHAAHADAVEGQLVKHILGPVLQQRRDAVADAIARPPVDAPRVARRACPASPYEISNPDGR